MYLGVKKEMKRFLVTLLCSLPFLVFGQQPSVFRPANNLSVGIGFISEKLPEGVSYYPQMLLAKLYLHHYGKRDGGLSLYAEPQFVPVILSGSNDMAFEFGANLGFQYVGKINKNVYASAAIGSGPHYITVQTDIQSPGYIFSDNFEVGFLFVLPKPDLQFNLRTRFRHISNAGIRNPNKGIDNWFLIFGLSHSF